MGYFTVIVGVVEGLGGGFFGLGGIGVCYKTTIKANNRLHSKQSLYTDS